MTTKSRRTRNALLVFAVILAAGVAWDPLDVRGDTSPSAGVPLHTAADALPRKAPTAPPLRLDAGASGRHAQPADADQPSTTACATDMRRQHLALLDRLAKPESPDAAIARGVLADLVDDRGGSAGRDRAFEDAMERWPDDPELAWFNTTRCGTETGCDRQKAVDTLLRLDPGNAAAWMQQMAHAWEAGDSTSFARALRSAAEAPYYDSYPGTIFLAVRGVLAKPPASCLEDEPMAALGQQLGREASVGDVADMGALGLEAASWTPGLSALSGCRAREVVSEQVQADCIRLLSKLAASDSILERQLGAGRLLELLPERSAQVALREQLRGLQWMTYESVRTSVPPDFIRRRFADGEFVTVREYLEAQGRWPPPPGWQPEGEAVRAP